MKTDMRAYIEANGHLPPDCVLGYIAWFSVNDAAYDADQLVKDFDRLQLNSALLPAPLRTDDAFEKASKEIDKFKYAVVGDRTAEILIREVARDTRTITRHMIREVKDSAGRRLLYEKVGELVFYKGATRGGIVRPVVGSRSSHPRPGPVAVGTRHTNARCQSVHRGIPPLP